MKKVYTSQDVARLAGVSQSTVSRVYTPGVRVSEMKKNKIIKAAEKLGYRPNAMARALITRKSGMIGIIMRSLENPFYPAVLKQFQTGLSTLGYHLIFINTMNEEIEESEIARLLEYNVEGVIITDAQLSSSTSDKFRRYKIPVVLFNRYIKSSNSSSVCCDNYHASKVIGSYLVASNHKYFGFISGPSNTSTTADRLRGFREVLALKKIRNLVIEPGEFTYESGYKSTKEMLTKHKNIECIFCGNDIMAIGAIDAIRDMQLSVPKDISVVGFDNIAMSGWSPYDLTTWEQPINQMVEAAVNVLLTEIKNKKSKPQKIVIKGQMVLRSSVRR